MANEDTLNPDTALKQVRSTIETLRNNEPILGSQRPNVEDFVRVSIPPGEGEALRQWIVEEDAAQTVEIGLAFGFSALYACAGLLECGHPDTRHVAMDPNQLPESVYDSRGLNILEQAGVSSLIEFHGEESQIALPRMFQEERQFDLAFIDGNHRFEAVFLDLFYLGRLVRKGGVIFLDDYNYPGIRKAADFFIKNLEWTVEDTSTEGTHEWAVLRTSKHEVTRHHRSFVDF